MLLPQATRDTNAWVVTGGTNVCVMKLVGDSLSDHQNSEMLLGVASWGQSFTRFSALLARTFLISFCVCRCDSWAVGAER